MHVLSAQHLRKSYSGKPVVQDVSLSVESGQVVGLLGPNGAGKTTCFYMIVGSIPADGGEIRFDTADLSNMPMHERARTGIGYLPQEASVFRRLSVADNIMAILETVSGLSRQDRQERQKRTDRPEDHQDRQERLEDLFGVLVPVLTFVFVLLLLVFFQVQF